MSGCKGVDTQSALVQPPSAISFEETGVIPQGPVSDPHTIEEVSPNGEGAETHGVSLLLYLFFMAVIDGLPLIIIIIYFTIVMTGIMDLDFDNVNLNTYTSVENIDLFNY